MSDAAQVAAQVAAMRRRLMMMIAMVAVCGLVAVGAIVGYLSYHIAWMAALFAVAVIAGFAAQIWLVVSVARAKPPQE